MSIRTLASRPARIALAAFAAMALTIAAADARPGRAGGFGGFGSRGGKTFSAPPSTYTAPRPASPIERSYTQPGSPGIDAPRTAPSPGIGAPGGFRPGFGTGFVGGLLGAGLLGMLFGHGLFGGIGGLGSLFGLLLQFGLIAMLVMFAMRFLRGRQPALAGAGAPMSRSGLGNGGSGLGSGIDVRPAQARSSGAGAVPPRQAAAPQRSDSVGIGDADYAAFEDTLKQVHDAWDREDLAALRGIATPEIAGYFAEELAKNAGRGLHDRVSDVKLVSGDLAEAWREGRTDYATVALRFSLVNAMVERATGRTVEGDPDRAEEVTEIWTFRREPGGRWMLSAIQQA
jgi:predicted lipid-binding transport protein (Tim44 family)